MSQSELKFSTTISGEAVCFLGVDLEINEQTGGDGTPCVLTFKRDGGASIEVSESAERVAIRFNGDGERICLIEALKVLGDVVKHLSVGYGK